MTDRIRTTHVGSLPRSKAVTEVLFGIEAGEDVPAERFEAVVGQATIDVVGQQKSVGIDLPSDGEMSKISYATYIADRLTGFEGDSPRRAPADLKDFPTFLEKLAKAGGTPTYRRPRCTGPDRGQDHAALGGRHPPLSRGPRRGGLRDRVHERGQPPASSRSSSRPTITPATRPT